MVTLLIKPKFPRKVTLEIPVQVIRAYRAQYKLRLVKIRPQIFQSLVDE